MFRDLHDAIRRISRQKAFTVAAVSTLALGIGGATTMFNVVHGVLLSPLPYAQPEQLVRMSVSIPQIRATNPVLPMRAADVEEIGRSVAAFDAVAAASPIEVNLTGNGEPERLYGARVTANFFSMLGVAAEQGRTFLGEEDTQGRDNVVVISHGLWQRRFGSDAAIVGKSVTLNGRPYTIAGVMPESLLFPTGTRLHPLVPFGPIVDVWKPAAYTKDELELQGPWNFAVIARVKSGYSLAAAQQELDGTMRSIVARMRTRNERFDLRGELMPLQDVLATKSKNTLMVLSIAVALLLAIACINLANLLLARLTDRIGELSVRIALGASRRDLVRLLLMESVVLAALGSAGGLLLATWGSPVLLSLAPAELASFPLARLATETYLFSIAVTLLTAVAFGVWPAFQVGRYGLGTIALGMMRTRGRTMGPRRGLVAAEVALCTCLLIVTGLLARSLVNLLNVPLGFRSENVVSMKLSLPAFAYTPQKGIDFYRQLVARVGAVPGVTSAAVGSGLPLQQGTETMQVFFESDTEARIERPIAVYRTVSEGYSTTLGIPLLSGRFLNEEEPRPVVVIDRTLAQRLWPGDPLPSIVGRRLRLGQVRMPPAEIVGIAGAVQTAAIDADSVPVLYQAQSQRYSQTMTLAVHTALDEATIAPQIQRLIWSLDANLPVSDVMTMYEIVRASTRTRTFQVAMIGLFALLELGLTLMGVYGVISYLVSQQSSAIGVRMAMGASRGSIVTWVMREALLPVAIGLAAGVVTAVFAATLVSGLLFNVTRYDPLTLTVVPLLLIAATAAACLRPALHASRLDPVRTLRTG
jgi:putative ABC transport system permease protein